MPLINRVTNTNVSLTNIEDRTYCNGNPYYDERTSSDPLVTEVMYKSWNHTPNYRSLARAKARLPDLHYLLRKGSRTESSTKHTWERTLSYDCTGQSGFSTRRSVQRVQELAHTAMDEGVKLHTEYSAIALLMSRARNAEFNVPVFVAEARRTADLVLGTARDLARSYQNLRRGNLRGAMEAIGLPPPRGAETRGFNRQYGRNPVDAASNRWLELQYGWKPLLNDAKNSAETLAELQTLPSKTEGRVSATTRLFTLQTDDNHLVMVSPNTKMRRIRNQEESYKAVWRFEPVWGIEAIASLGLTNPALVAWELLPLSFVIDWFLPIGRYIEQFDNFIRFKHVGGTLGYRRRVITTYDKPVRSGWTSSDLHSTNWMLVERTPFTGVPQLGLESIRWDPNMGASRILSGLALARQAFR